MSRCPVIADEGTAVAQQCFSEEHPDTPDEHDFRGVSARPVDGGRHWSDWIQMVTAVRDRLLGRTFAAGTPEGEALREIAALVGLTSVERNGTVEVSEE